MRCVPRRRLGLRVLGPPRRRGRRRRAPLPLPPGRLLERLRRRAVATGVKRHVQFEDDDSGDDGLSDGSADDDDAADGFAESDSDRRSLQKAVAPGSSTRRSHCRSLRRC